MSISRNIAIVGGGAAGLMGAEVLATMGHKVTVYDAMASVGRKFLLAGAHGGLNLTHSEPLDSFITRYGTASTALTPALTSLSPEKVCAWCHDLGQPTFIGSSGRVFPVGMSSKPLLRAWLKRLETLGVAFATRHRWQGWNKLGELCFQTPEAQIDVKADATLLALGGASWPRTGSDGGWVDVLAREDVPLAPLRAANCGFTVPWSPYISHRFAGMPLKPVVVSFGERTLQGEIMITDKGIEGGVIYALSGAIRSLIESEGKATLHLDLRPGLPLEGLVLRLRVPRKAQSFSTYLQKAGGLSPLAIALIRETTPPESLPIHDVEGLAALIKATPLTLTATASMERAISTAGGVKFEALDEHFMLKDKPGVFIAGEMMDWEAPTGGYLMQGCFSTAVWAADGIEKYLQST